MKNQVWEIIKFAVKVNVRYCPRLFVAPLIGAWRNTWQEIGRMDAEVDEFKAQLSQRSASNG